LPVPLVKTRMDAPEIEAAKLSVKAIKSLLDDLDISYN